MSFPYVPNLCSEKACPYKAFVFKYIDPYLRRQRKKWEPTMTSPTVLGFCILHKNKIETVPLAGTIYKSRNEIEGLALTDRVIEE